MTVWAKRDVTVQSTVTLYTSTWDRKTERWISVRSCYFISDWSVFCSWVLSIVCCPAWLVPKKTVTSWKNVEKDIMSVPPLWECCDETDWVSAWVLYTGIVWEFENYTHFSHFSYAKSFFVSIFLFFCEFTGLFFSLPIPQIQALLCVPRLLGACRLILWWRENHQEINEHVQPSIPSERHNMPVQVLAALSSLFPLISNFSNPHRSFSTLLYTLHIVSSSLSYIIMHLSMY